MAPGSRQLLWPRDHPGTSMVAFAGIAVLTLVVSSAPPAGESRGRWWSCSRARAVVTARRPTTPARRARPPIGVIALTLPVTWDYLGWKDALGSRPIQREQKAYTMARGDRKVFTASGGERCRAPSVTIRAPSSRRSRTPSIELAVHRGHRRGGRGRIEWWAEPVDIPQDGEIWLLTTAAVREVAIARGENQGETVPTSMSCAR